MRTFQLSAWNFNVCGSVAGLYTHALWFCKGKPGLPGLVKKSYRPQTTTRSNSASKSSPKPQPLRPSPANQLPNVLRASPGSTPRPNYWVLAEYQVDSPGPGVRGARSGGWDSCSRVEGNYFLYAEGQLRRTVCSGDGQAPLAVKSVSARTITRAEVAFQSMTEQTVARSDMGSFCAMYGRSPSPKKTETRDPL